MFGKAITIFGYKQIIANQQSWDHGTRGNIKRLKQKTSDHQSNQQSLGNHNNRFDHLAQG
jgi:hypothetical protein